MVTNDAERCLQCGLTREEIQTEGVEDCATTDGYWVVETIAEWDEHRWEPWTDAELAEYRICPAAFGRYRRATTTELNWPACEDTVTGHDIPTDPKWGSACRLCAEPLAATAQTTVRA